MEQSKLISEQKVIIETAIDNSFKNLEKGTIKVQTVSDVKDMIEIYKMLKEY